eukprot:4855735-Prymnesium_polylepis.2
MPGTEDARRSPDRAKEPPRERSHNVAQCDAAELTLGEPGVLERARPFQHNPYTCTQHHKPLHSQAHCTKGAWADTKSSRIKLESRPN